MAGPFSPSKEGGGGYLYGGSPPEDISMRMRVPKRIKANGDVLDEEHNGGYPPQWEAPGKLDMNVPDRIMLLGGDRHLGTRAPPREIVLENSVLGNALTMEDVRVNTPPRVITLERHCFPSALEDADDSPDESSPRAFNIIRPAPVQDTPRVKQHAGNMTFRDATPPLEGLSAAEEVVHLRRQVARINKRVMAIEFDTQQRQQREKIIYAVGMVYILYKVIAWLNRS